MTTVSTKPRVALTTYSVKPRGGVVHTLELAEALAALGVDVTIIAMGDPEVGFFREVDVPVIIVPAPDWGDTLEERVFSWIEAMTIGLNRVRDDFDIIHSQDCISARAAARVRDEGAPFRLIRTVHHVDDFTTQALIDCQISAIREPDEVLVVSELWRKQLLADYGVAATVVHNGVRAERFATPISSERRAELRARIGATDKFLYLTVGGIEPRKGSEFLVEALGRLKADPCGADVMLAVVGGHSFQDYAPYRERVLGGLEQHGLKAGGDLALLGTVSDDELPEWFHAADGFVFPSINEGWGLVVLEAMSAGLPVVASDIEVFHEFMTHEENAIMTATGDSHSLAIGMERLVMDSDLAASLRAAGPAVAAQFSWISTAEQHAAIYG
ncbi:MSMEG_0565 family glycosyltransferase [uncultured Ilumatobacter sp.]|jgi:glycosyltransferase-like protein|uniref:MSMEG_0565 family glycosyltransferase n=1 Tax=uncultured Ilumatobacter sp. TaxID=879968 RepID=UPI00374F669F|tara:strand:- start:1081 stop:2238 length:1158 start_codon:yes stop_codon:yes gene_type:complete